MPSEFSKMSNAIVTLKRDQVIAGGMTGLLSVSSTIRKFDSYNCSGVLENCNTQVFATY